MKRGDLMTDLEKVLNGLERRSKNLGCMDDKSDPLCPYARETGCDLGQLMMDAAERFRPVEPMTAEDMDTFGGCWWYVCPGCRCAVDYKDAFCRHCGRPFKWPKSND